MDIKCKATILLPVRYNDGAAIEHEKIEAILERLVNNFGGYSSFGVCQGAYRMDDGSVAIDSCTVITVVFDDTADNKAKIDSIASYAARELQQECIYLEVSLVAVGFVRPSK